MDCIIPFSLSMTRLMIHQGKHNHPIKPQTSCASIEGLKKLVDTLLKFNKGSEPWKI